MPRPHPCPARRRRSPTPPPWWNPTTTSTRAPVTAAVEALAVDECTLEYEVAAGDFWIRIADGSGARLADVLAVNDATVSTPLYPGRSICLPAGATIPSPPPAATTARFDDSGQLHRARRNSSTTSSTSTASTTPTTTTPPPPPPPPPSPVSPAEVEAIIRSVWPDELEERALEVAWRESNYRPTAKNSCCYGLFQIYWSAHQELAERSRHHVGRTTLRSGHECSCGTRPLRAVGRLGPLGRLTRTVGGAAANFEVCIAATSAYTVGRHNPALVAQWIEHLTTDQAVGSSTLSERAEHAGASQMMRGPCLVEGPRVVRCDRFGVHDRDAQIQSCAAS